MNSRLKSSIIIIILLLLTVSPSNSASSSQESLEKIKAEFMGKEVMIRGYRADKKLQQLAKSQEPLLMNWFFANEDGKGGFTKPARDLVAHVPYRINGSVGTVIWIGPDKYGVKTVVKVNDSLIITSDSIYGIGWEHFVLMDIIQRQREEISQNINGIVGKTIYPVASSIIYPPSFGIEDCADLKNRKLSISLPFKNLTPLEIIEAEYIENEHAIMLIIKNQENKQLGKVYSEFRRFEGVRKDKKTFLEAAAFGFLENVTNKLTDQEIVAIKNNKVFKGMSKDALYYSIGFPEKRVDRGNGVMQLIYGVGTSVYLKDNLVIDF